MLTNPVAVSVPSIIPFQHSRTVRLTHSHRLHSLSGQREHNQLDLDQYISEVHGEKIKKLCCSLEISPLPSHYSSVSVFSLFLSFSFYAKLNKHSATIGITDNREQLWESLVVGSITDTWFSVHVFNNDVIIHNTLGYYWKTRKSDISQGVDPDPNAKNEPPEQQTPNLSLQTVTTNGRF